MNEEKGIRLGKDFHTFDSDIMLEVTHLLLYLYDLRTGVRVLINSRLQSNFSDKKSMDETT